MSSQTELQAQQMEGQLVQHMQRGLLMETSLCAVFVYVKLNFFLQGQI